MSLSENIREARLQAGLSQEQVAEALEVSRQAVSRWERGVSLS
ncbi:helix-turn-helix domain-containing protein [bacterium 210820-DFI.6.52]|nr:helix-turn-helix domain-containing protein [bacterium 210820-DFI.6.52]